MKISVSKIKVVKAILLGFLLFGGSVLVSVKYHHDVFSQDYSVLNGFKIQIIPLVVGIFCIFGILMFGGMTLVFISRLFYNEPQVIINLEGIEDKRLNTGLIKWNEIDSVMLMETKNAQWLNVILESPEKYYRRLPKHGFLIKN